MSVTCPKKGRETGLWGQIRRANRGDLDFSFWGEAPKQELFRAKTFLQKNVLDVQKSDICFFLSTLVTPLLKPQSLNPPFCGTIFALHLGRILFTCIHRNPEEIATKMIIFRIFL